jgi:hypothetical protein
MRRVGLVLVISAVALALIAGPARAQTEQPTVGCIPTSDTPFQTGLVGPLDPFSTLFLATGPPVPTIVDSTTVVNPDGTASFRPGIASGVYDVVLVRRGTFFEPLGTLQIGNCTPTSKEQCKNGGWRNFLGFKNEGQCIAFVKHGS